MSKLSFDMFFDLSQLPIDDRKTKLTNPYNYDPIVQFIGSESTNGSVYTDRLYQFDSKKHDTLCKKHFGNVSQYWNNRDPKQIEAFLRDWYEDQELTLTEQIEFCNQSTGYPTWYLGFHESKS